jgi:hypothetical protein
VTDETPQAPPALPAPTSRQPRRIRFSRFAIVGAAAILAAGASSPWWLPFLRPAPTSSAPAAPAAPVPAPVPPAPDHALAERIERLQADVEQLKSAPPPAAAPEDDTAQLRSEIGALSRRLDALPAQQPVDPQTVASLAEGLDKLQARIGTVESRLAERHATAQNQLALVLGAAQIEAALAGGEPYDAAIELILPAAADDLSIQADLAVLERRAKSGIESRVRLAQELEALPAKLSSEPEPPPTDAGFWQRTVSRLSGLVRVRRIEDEGKREAGPAGPDRIVADAEERLAAGDLAAAIEAVKGLDGRAAELAAPWLTAATQRLEAERAARSLATTLAKRLTAEGRG